MALVDDDPQSAALLMRTLKALGSPPLRWFDGAIAGQQDLVSLLADEQADHPALLVVDLKSHSEANADFLRDINKLARRAGILMVAMSHSDRPSSRDALLQAGAAAVFLRHADSDAYRREAASLLSFWTHSLRPAPVGM